MPRLPKGEAKMTFRTQIFLPDEWAEALKRLADERGAPVGVLARQAVIEWLRERSAQEGYPRMPLNRAAEAPATYESSERE